MLREEAMKIVPGLAGGGLKTPGSATS